MKLRTLAAFALVTSAVGFAAPAAAKDMGLRFETGAGLSGTVSTATNTGDLRVGYDLPGGITPLIGLSFRQITSELFDADDNSLGSNGTTVFVLNIEGRYYMKPHKKGLQPFVFAGVDFLNTSFGTEDKDGKAINEADDAADGDALSPWGFNLGFGLEYKFAKAFAVGGKWGLNMAFNGTEIQKKAGETAGRNSSNTNWGTASSMYLAWRM